MTSLQKDPLLFLTDHLGSDDLSDMTDPIRKYNADNIHSLSFR